MAFDSIKGPDNADWVVLGKYDSGGESSYVTVAENMQAQYFQLDTWDELSSRYSADEIWKINERFLDIQTSSGRSILLTHDPELHVDKQSSYSRELKYLLNNGYRFIKQGDMWYAIR